MRSSCSGLLFIREAEQGTCVHSLIRVYKVVLLTHNQINLDLSVDLNINFP